MLVKVDASGLACPEPVIATKKALEELSEGVVTTIVDNLIAKENVMKFAVANHYGVSVEEDGGRYYIKITKGSAPSADAAKGAELGKTVCLFSANTMGRGNEELGAILVKSFIYSMLETEPLPKSLLFINSGVLLTTEGSPVLENLNALAEKGVRILSCGTCLDFYSLKDKLAVGDISNMYSILDELNAAGRVITI